MTLEQVKKTLDDNGFWCNIEENMFGQGEQGIEFGMSSSLGEDWFENIEAKDAEDFITNLERRVDGWDSEEEAMPYIEMRGQNGVPSSIRDLLDDADWKLDQLKDLLNALKNLPADEKVEEAENKGEEKAKLNFVKNVDDLPDYCYGVLPSDNTIIIIKKGETGYHPTTGYNDLVTGETYNERVKSADKIADDLNQKMGVTPDQRFTMELRSMGGNWKNITESKELTEAYTYFWKDDIEEVESNEANDDIWYAVAEHMQETDDYYKDWDPIEVMSDIICLWKINKRSRLYKYLLEWYGSEDKLLANVRDVYETKDAIYFVTGVGYSIFSADLLGGTADGIAEKDFDKFVYNKENGIKTENKEIKTEAPDDSGEQENNENQEEPSNEADEKLDALIQEWEDKNSLYERVISEIVEDSEDYSQETKLERIKARLDDISMGLVNGTVGSLIYYDDTVAFFDKYYDDIYDFIDEMVSYGVEPLEGLKNHLDESEIIMGTDTMKNQVVWMVYEEIAYMFGEQLDQLSE